jgi:protein-disulfide isomerase-like protein with CxxC motif
MTNLEQAAGRPLEAMEAALDKSVYDNHFSCRAILTAQIVELRAALVKIEDE